jgi:hypothetical protein
MYSRRRVRGDLLELVASVGATLVHGEASSDATTESPNRVQGSGDLLGMGEFADATLTPVAAGPVRTVPAREQRRG